MEFITIHLRFSKRNGCFVDKFITIINSNKLLCGSFGVCPIYVAGILNSVEKINYFVLHSEQINYAYYVENAFSVKGALSSRLQTTVLFYGTPFSVNVWCWIRYNIYYSTAISKTAVRTNICTMCAKNNAFFIANVLYCAIQQTCDMQN